MKNKAILTRLTILLFIVFTIPLTISQAQENEYKIFLPVVANNFDAAWEWQSPSMVTLTPKPNYYDPMLMSIDFDGFPHLWWDTLYTPKFIYHTRLTSQGWLTPTQVADTLGTSETLFPPVLDSQGKIHLLWYNWLGVGVENPYRLMYAEFSNGGWQPEEEVVKTDQELQGRVHLDAQGNVYVTLEGLFSVMGQTKRTPGGWTPSMDIDPNHSVRLVWPDMQGGVHLYGESSYPIQQVIYSYWKDGQFLMNGQTTPGDLPSGDSQLDGLNNLHLFRRAQVPVPGGTVYGIYHRCLTNNLTWTDEQVLSNYQDTQSSALKASDQVSQVALVWQESTGNQVQVRIFEGCSLTHKATVILPLEDDWELESAAITQNPGMFCFLAHKLLGTTEFLVQCATLEP